MYEEKKKLEKILFEVQSGSDRRRHVPDPGDRGHPRAVDQSL